MDAVRLFQDFQSLYGFCPCCGELFRLSDAQLFHKKPPPRTPWDDLDEERARLERSVERLERDVERLREEASEAGRRERERRLSGLMSVFRRERIALTDMKLLFHPVDYIVFRGLGRRTCTAVEFLDSEPISKSHERLQRSIERTIEAGNYAWVTMRVDDRGRVRCT